MQSRGGGGISALDSVLGFSISQESGFLFYMSSFTLYVFEVQYVVESAHFFINKFSQYTLLILLFNLSEFKDKT